MTGTLRAAPAAAFLPAPPGRPPAASPTAAPPPRRPRKPLPRRWYHRPIGGGVRGGPARSPPLPACRLRPRTAPACAASEGGSGNSDSSGGGGDGDDGRGGVPLPGALRSVASAVKAVTGAPARAVRGAHRAALGALGVGDNDDGASRRGPVAGGGGGGGGDSSGGRATERGSAPPFSFGTATALASFAFEAYAEPPHGCGWLVPGETVAVAGDGGGGGGATPATDDAPPLVNVAYPTPGELAGRCPHGALRVTLGGLHRPGRDGGGNEDDRGHLCYTLRTGGVVVDRPAVGTAFAVPAPPPPGERRRGEEGAHGDRDDAAAAAADSVPAEGGGEVTGRAAAAAAADVAVVDVFWGPEEVSAGRPLGWVALPLPGGIAHRGGEGGGVNAAPTRLELPLTLYPAPTGVGEDREAPAVADAAAAATAAAAAAAAAAGAAQATAVARGASLFGTAPDTAPALWADAADSGFAALRAASAAARADAAARRAAVAGSSLVVWVAHVAGGSDDSGGGGNESLHEDEAPADKDDAIAAVEGLPMSDGWKALAKEVMAASDEADSHLNRRRLRAVAFMAAPSTDTKVWVWRDATRRVAVVGFRGTESLSWKDLVTDAAAWQVPWTPGGPIDLDVCPATAASASEESALVHWGFLRAYASVREPLLAELAAITEELSAPWDVYYTGHSLGGALATLAAADVRAQHPNVGGAMVSFGQPKVGNAAFRLAVDTLLPAAFRIVNDADVVARTPTGGYAHVGRTVLVNEDGELWVEPWGAEGSGGGGGSDENGTQGGEADPTGGSTADAAADGDAGGHGLGGARWKATGTLFAAEKELWRSFTTGASLQHHLEDSYVASLRRCVKQQREAGAV